MKRLNNIHKLKNKSRGFTLIELLLYVGIVAIFVGGIVQFAWDIIYARVKTNVQQEISQNIRLASQRISNEIRNAQDINSVSGSTLSLAVSDSARNPTVFDLDNGRLRIGYGTMGDCPLTAPCYLTSDSVVVTNLVFTDNSSGEDSINVRFEIALEFNNSSGRQEFEKAQTYATSIELRSN